MKLRRIRRLTSWTLAVLLVCGTAFCASAQEADAVSDTALMGEEGAEIVSDNEFFQDFAGQAPEEPVPMDPELQTESIEELFGDMETETESSLPDMMSETEPVYPQLTAEDIVRLDNGDAEILYDDDGKVTFIRGRYSPEKVTDPEGAAASLNYVSGLLGLTKGALLFCVYKGIDYTTGYTYYLFLQRDGDVSVLNASIKIYVDPDGYTAALSCSFNPDTGIREETPGSITAADAERIVLETFPDDKLTLYPDYTIQASIMEKERNKHVWAVFTSNPDAKTGKSDMPYLQHFVSYTGRYEMNLPCYTLETPLLEKDDALERRAKAMFEGYDRDSWTGDVKMHDGRTVRLTVPVARSRADGRYYLMDLDRMILVADYREVYFGSGEYIISSSDTNSGWKEKELIALYNIGRVYDYFDDHGYPSVDGSGIPMAILSGVCEPDGSAIDNAYFSGYQNGFGNFAISDINNTVECLDVMAHEYTHGITSYTMGGSAYVNELGAINEAFSDIMGNLCELTFALNDLSIRNGKTTGQFDLTGTSPYGSTDDPNPAYPDWRIGEMGGKTYRDMSNPIVCQQPAFVGDAYYVLPTDHSNNLGNDYGGVHENSSLLGSIAWVMNEHGLNFERQYSLWMTAMNMMTPKSDYDDILQALIFARKSYGWEEEIDTWLTEAFAERGLLEHSHSFSGTWDGMTFTRYNADYLKVLQPQQQTEDPVTGSLNSLLTGGSSGQQKETDSLADSVTGSPDDPSKEVKAKKWLEGVGLDTDGRIAREGFGRIDLDTSPGDREILVGVSVLDAFTGYVTAINCMDEEGHVSFLLPEGVYGLVLGVSRGGLNQIEFWPYTQGGSYEPQSYLTLPGEVEVKAGQNTVLPPADVF